ncbi:MAG: hypothetical protein MUE37_00010 [Bacteroidales bacterium]|nr:hypothetical protein [Bacteroidales bacterium]
MTITGVAGDTVLQFNDLFADAYEGLDQNPLTLTANLVMAQPLHSGEKYRWIIKISDKTGTGRFESSLDFDLVPNSNLSIRAEGINCREIYLYSAAQAKIITDNIVTAGEDIYLVFEGLQGVTPESGRMPAGLSMTATDSAGTIILNETDLIGENGMDPEQFAKQVAPSFNFSGTDIKNPVACEVKIWDKTSSKHISANFTLDLKQ